MFPTGFPTSRLYVGIAGAAGALLVAAVLVSAGYRAGKNAVQADWDRIEKDRAAAIVGLAERYVAADAEAQRLRATAQTVVTQRVTRNVIQVKTLPDRRCGWSADERRLLLDTYCASFPAAAGCVPGALPATGAPARNQ